MADCLVFRKPAERYKLDAADIKATKLPMCVFCGGFHLGLCRRVIEIEYYPDGGVQHAILRETWDTTQTTWPWEVSED